MKHSNESNDGRIFANAVFIFLFHNTSNSDIEIDFLSFNLNEYDLLSVKRVHSIVEYLNFIISIGHEKEHCDVGCAASARAG